MNSYDIDGVIYLGHDLVGVRPGPDDIIITGRSYQEAPGTLAWLRHNGIQNNVFFNPAKIEEKTRKGSGHHKATILEAFSDLISIHFEDDPIQAEVIALYCPVRVVRLEHKGIIRY